MTFAEACEVLHLSPKEMTILCVLARHRHRPIQTLQKIFLLTQTQICIFWSMHSPSPSDSEAKSVIAKALIDRYPTP